MLGYGLDRSAPVPLYILTSLFLFVLVLALDGFLSFVSERQCPLLYQDLLPPQRDEPV